MHVLKIEVFETDFFTTRGLMLYTSTETIILVLSVFYYCVEILMQDNLHYYKSSIKIRSRVILLV